MLKCELGRKTKSLREWEIAHKEGLNTVMRRLRSERDTSERFEGFEREGDPELRVRHGN